MSKGRTAVPKGIKKTGEVDAITIMVRTDSLIPSPWNPTKRIQLRDLADLVDSMRTRGFLEALPILVAADNSMIIDGHRRHATAMHLQIKEVPATLMDGDPQDLWSMINGTRMTVTGRQVVEAYNRGLRVVPANYVGLMNRLTEVVGEEDLKGLDISPFIISHAGQLAKYLGHEGNNEFLKTIVLWLAKWPRMNTLTRAAMKSNTNPNEIERAILRNHPMQVSFKG